MSFNDDPRPSNAKGLMYLPDSSEYLVINRKGEVRSVVQGKLINTTDFEAPDKSVAPLVQPEATIEQVAATEKTTTTNSTKKQAKSKQNKDDDAPAPESANQQTAIVIDGEFDITSVTGSAENKTLTKGVSFRKTNKKSASTVTEQSSSENQNTAVSSVEHQLNLGSAEDSHAAESADTHSYGNYEVEDQESLSLDEFMGLQPSIEFDNSTVSSSANLNKLHHQTSKRMHTQHPKRILQPCQTP